MRTARCTGLLALPQPLAQEGGRRAVAELDDLGDRLGAVGGDVGDHRGHRHLERPAERLDHGAAAGAALDQAGILQARHGAAHGDARDAEQLGELFLGRQQLAGGIAAGGDAVGQHQVDLVMQRRAEVAVDGDAGHAADSAMQAPVDRQQDRVGADGEQRDQHGDGEDGLHVVEVDRRHQQEAQAALRGEQLAQHRAEQGEREADAQAGEDLGRVAGIRMCQRRLRRREPHRAAGAQVGAVDVAHRVHGEQHHRDDAVQRAERDLGRHAEPEQQQDHRIERDLGQRVERRPGSARRPRPRACGRPAARRCRRRRSRRSPAPAGRRGRSR